MGQTEGPFLDQTLKSQNHLKDFLAGHSSPVELPELPPPPLLPSTNQASINHLSRGSMASTLRPSGNRWGGARLSKGSPAPGLAGSFPSGKVIQNLGPVLQTVPLRNVRSELEMRLAVGGSLTPQPDPQSRSPKGLPPRAPAARHLQHPAEVCVSHHFLFLVFRPHR